MVAHDDNQIPTPADARARARAHTPGPAFGGRPCADQRYNGAVALACERYDDRAPRLYAPDHTSSSTVSPPTVTTSSTPSVPSLPVTVSASIATRP